MSEERTLILTMLAEGKITVEEAEQLLEALGTSSTKETAEERRTKCGQPVGEWNGKVFGDLFDKGFGEEGPFNQFFGEEGLFSEFFGAKCGTEMSGQRSAKS